MFCPYLSWTRVSKLSSAFSWLLIDVLSVVSKLREESHLLSVSVTALNPGPRCCVVHAKRALGAGFRNDQISHNNPAEGWPGRRCALARWPRRGRRIAGLIGRKDAMAHGDIITSAAGVTSARRCHARRYYLIDRASLLFGGWTRAASRRAASARDLLGAPSLHDYLPELATSKSV